MAAFATLLGASAQGATGMGFSLVVSPVLLAVMPAAAAITTLLVLTTVLNSLMLVTGRARHVRWPDMVHLLIGAVPGLIAGAVILKVVPKPLLQILVGGGIVALVGQQFIRERGLGGVRHPPLSVGQDTFRVVASAVGFLSGALTTSTGLNGPPLALWLAARGASPVEIRDSLQACFLFLSIFGAPTVVLIAEEGAGTPHLFAITLLVPLVWLGHIAGRTIFRMLNPNTYRLGLMSIATLAGVVSVTLGLLSV